MLRLSEPEKAYIAGIVDGEGTISIRTSEHRRQLYVHIGNTDKRLIDWLLKILGCGATTSYQHREDWKPCHSFRIICQQAGEFLEEIYPYLILKKRHAEIGINFVRGQRGLRGKRITQDRLNNELILQKEIKKLNIRGVPVDRFAKQTTDI